MQLKLKIIFIILMCSIFFFSSLFYLNKSVLGEEIEEEQEINIDGVWTVFDKTEDISKLLNLTKVPNSPTFCMNILFKKQKAIIYFYSDKKYYEIKIKRNKVNEYEFVNRNQKLGFIITQRKDYKQGGSGKKFIYMGIKDWDGVLRYKQHGGLDCQWNGDLKKCSSNEVERCLKDAKENDDYYKEEKALPADLE